MCTMKIIIDQRCDLPHEPNTHAEVVFLIIICNLVPSSIIGQKN